MEEISELLKKISLSSTFTKNSDYWVNVTHIIDPHNFYVQPCLYKQHLQLLETSGEKADFTELNIGSKIIFESKVAKKKVRGEIVSMKENLCQVYAMDYGFTENDVRPEQMYLPAASHPVPGLATKCKLATCEPVGDTFSDRAIAAMKFFIGTERARMFIKQRTPDALVVQLYNSHPEDIATMLAITTHTTLCGELDFFSNPGPARPSKMVYEHKKLIIGDNLHVTFLSGDCQSGFYVSEDNDHMKYLNNHPQFCGDLNKARKLSPEKLKVGIPVAFSKDGKYERAIVKEILVPGQKAIVQQVDWGVCTEAHISTLKPLVAAKYFSWPVALYCKVDEVQAWHNSFLGPYEAGRRMVIQVCKIGNQFETPHDVTVQLKT